MDTELTLSLLQLSTGDNYFLYPQYSLLQLSTVFLKLLGLHSCHHCSGFISIMKASPSSDMSVIWIDIWDSQKGTKGKTLINRSFNFGCHTATIWGTAMHPGVAQYHNCWHWGHSTHACRTQGAKCQKCGGPHRMENHRSMAWCCKANSKSNPSRETTANSAPCPHTFKCLNCKGEHSANDTKCPFWCHRFDKQ